MRRSLSVVSAKLVLGEVGKVGSPGPGDPSGGETPCLCEAKMEHWGPAHLFDGLFTDHRSYRRCQSLILTLNFGTGSVMSDMFVSCFEGEWLCSVGADHSRAGCSSNHARAVAACSSISARA